MAAKRADFCKTDSTKDEKEFGYSIKLFFTSFNHNLAKTIQWIVFIVCLTSVLALVHEVVQSFSKKKKIHLQIMGSDWVGPVNGDIICIRWFKSFIIYQKQVATTFSTVRILQATVKVERANITAFMDCELNYVVNMYSAVSSVFFGFPTNIYDRNGAYLAHIISYKHNHPQKVRIFSRRPFACTFPFVSWCWYIPFVWFTHLCVEHAIEIGFRLSCTNAQKYLSLEANSGKQTQKLSEKKQVKEHSQRASMFHEQCALFKYTSSICSAHGRNRFASQRIMNMNAVRQ